MNKALFEMRKFSFICSLLFILINTSYSQSVDSVTIKQHSFELQSGYGFYRVKDVTESPLVYKHSFVPFNLIYNFQSTKWIHDINFLFFYTTLKSSITKGSFLSTQNITAGLDYSFLRNTNLKLPRNSNFYAGGSLINFGSYRNHNYTRVNQINGDVFFELAIKTNIIKKINSNSCISWDCSLPVFAYVMLRRYNINGLPDAATNTSFNYLNLLKTGEFLAINKFVDFQTRFKYTVKYSNRWDISFTYLFRFYHYYRYESSFPVDAGINTLEMGLKLKL